MLISAPDIYCCFFAVSNYTTITTITTTMNFRPVLKTTATLFLLGTLLTQLLSLLTGGSDTSILKRFYWLETDCSGFNGTPNGLCRWTNYNICGVENGHNVDCSSSRAAHAFAPARQFDREAVPSAFADNDNYYYYMSRIGWAFLLIGTAFTLFAMVPYVVGLFKHSNALKGSFWAMYALALIFTIVGVCLSTAVYVRGRNKFRDAGLDASLGVKTMAVSWVAVFLLLFNIPFLAFAGKHNNNPNEVVVVKEKRNNRFWWWKKRDADGFQNNQSVSIRGPAKIKKLSTDDVDGDETLYP